MVKRKMPQDKHRSTKHYTENYRSSNMNPTKTQGWIQVIRNGKQMWHWNEQQTSTANKLFLNQWPSITERLCPAVENLGGISIVGSCN